jgi:Tfp pilus assembly protein PilF
MPDHIGTWHGLGWTALFLHDLAGAQAAFQHALELDRNFGESHGGMAVVLARTGQRAAAEEAVEIALRLDRHGMAAHYARAVLDGQADDSAQLQRLAARLLKARRSSRAQ